MLTGATIIVRFQQLSLGEDNTLIIGKSCRPIYSCNQLKQTKN